ncbi:MAG TPA: spore coat protein GerQ [Bacillales bacterium]|nr:spore coat protein GerQ [Bacillales bacterium]
MSEYESEETREQGKKGAYPEGGMMQSNPYSGYYGGAAWPGYAQQSAYPYTQASYPYGYAPQQPSFQSQPMGGSMGFQMGGQGQHYYGVGGTGAPQGVAGAGGFGQGVFGGVPPSIAQQVQEASYIENILRLNAGKVATIYMSFENNSPWSSKVFTGVIEAAGKDHIILRERNGTRRYVLLMIYVDYITFETEINYFYPPAPQFYSISG